VCWARCCFDALLTGLAGTNTTPQVRNAVTLLSMGFGQTDVEAALTAEILREPMAEGRGGVHGVSGVFGYVRVTDD
jgi:hypothetical protein